MPTGEKFGTHVVLQIWTITYFTSVSYDIEVANFNSLNLPHAVKILFTLLSLNDNRLHNELSQFIYSPLI